MTDLSDLLGPQLVEAIERCVDERVRAALAEHRDRSDPPWLTIAEAADYLRVSERTVDRLVARRRLRSSTIGRRRLVSRDDLDAYMRATTGEEVAPTTPPRRRRR